MIPLFDLSGGVATWLVVVVLLLLALGAGAIGSLVGIGGGLFLVPSLVLLFGLDIHLAVAASLLAVVANSCGSGATYVEEGLANLRLGMFLETATAVGGLFGALLSVTWLVAQGNLIVLAFVPVVGLSIFLMYGARNERVDPNPPADRVADRLALGGSYREDKGGVEVAYRVTRSGYGLALVGVAGVASGLLGVGGGTFNVPAMNAVMNVPIRVATATSTFKIGITATAGAFIYLTAGDVYLLVAAPVVLGSLVGSLLGSHYQARARATSLRGLFLVVLVIAAISMAARGLGYLT